MLALVSVSGAEQFKAPATAPVPPQVAAAHSVFIANAGGESLDQITDQTVFNGGPDRPYNEFYAAMKSWGRFELVSAPTDADLVFEIGFSDQYQGPMLVSQFKLVILDSKMHVALWTIYKYVEPAGMAKNREKNYELAMTALIEDVKNLVAPPAATSSK